MKKSEINYKKIPYPPQLADLSHMVDEAAFLSARVAVLSESVARGGVGTLSEKSLHKMLKLYIEPNSANHEVAYLGMIADVKNEGGVYEIQTRAYSRLSPKLKKMLAVGRVTVVCPLAFNKTVRWIDCESGEIGKENKSPKHENIYDATFNLFGIREHLQNENLSVMLVFLEAEEYRALDGWDKSKKRGSNRVERIPNKILDTLLISDSKRFSDFIPDSLPDTFVASEFSRVIGRTSRFTYYVLKALVAAGALCECGKRGRAVLYSRTDSAIKN